MLAFTKYAPETSKIQLTFYEFLKVLNRGGGGWKLEESGIRWPSWGRDGEREHLKRYHDRESHYGARRKLDAREISRNSQG